MDIVTKRIEWNGALEQEGIASLSGFSCHLPPFSIISTTFLRQCSLLGRRSWLVTFPSTTSQGLTAGCFFPKSRPLQSVQ